MSIYGRTDLAVEARDLRIKDNKKVSELKGVKAKKEIINGIELSTVEILNEEGAAALGKPIGKYFTMQLNERYERGSDIFSSAATSLAQLIKDCIPLNEPSVFLIAALGNSDITPDALGSIAASNIIVTQHLKNTMPEEFKSFSTTMLCRTGVLGTTGIESAAQIKALCERFKPDCVIAIDALAGVELNRLCHSFQVSSSGISPGSGVGNNRQELSFQSLGVPVVSIGVPTVIDAAQYSDLPELKGMFVTPRDIDSAVRSAGRLIGYGINLAIHPMISIEDIDMLVG